MKNGTNGEPAVEITRKSLTQEQVEFFALNGYLDMGAVFTAEEVELYRGEYDAVFDAAQNGDGSFRNLSINDTTDLDEKKNASTRMLQIMQMSERNIHFHRLLYDTRLLDMVEDLVGPNLQLFHDQGLYKPAHDGGAVFWHQDNAYWKCIPANLVSCWITLDDVDVSNGAMQFIPGSHLRPVGHETSTETGSLLDVESQVDTSKAVAVPLPAGGVTLHHCQTLHYTQSNTTDRQRRAFVIHYMPPGTRSVAHGEMTVSFPRPILRMG